jgi:hypothetical protein
MEIDELERARNQLAGVSPQQIRAALRSLPTEGQRLLAPQPARLKTFVPAAETIRESAPAPTTSPIHGRLRQFPWALVLAFILAAMAIGAVIGSQGTSGVPEAPASHRSVATPSIAGLDSTMPSSGATAPSPVNPAQPSSSDGLAAGSSVPGQPGAAAAPNNQQVPNRGK